MSFLADATEESGGPLPTDVGDLADGRENSSFLGQPKCDRSAQADQGLRSKHKGQWLQQNRKRHRAPHAQPRQPHNLHCTGCIQARSIATEEASLVRGVRKTETSG